MVVIQGRVAQLGERHAYTVDVTGSSPVPPTIQDKAKNSESCPLELQKAGAEVFNRYGI